MLCVLDRQCALQICDNYAVASIQSGHPLEAARAFARSVDLSAGAHVNAAVLDALVATACRGRGAPAAAPPRPAVQAPLRPAVAPVGASDSEDEPNTAGMSRSQLKRLRKKKRDGKGA